MRISDCSSDVCSSDLADDGLCRRLQLVPQARRERGRTLRRLRRADPARGRGAQADRWPRGPAHRHRAAAEGQAGRQQLRWVAGFGTSLSRKTRTCSRIGPSSSPSSGEVMSKEVLAGVRDLLPTFRDRADEAERLRQVPESSVKALEETGFFRMLQPKRFDGLESDPVDFFTAVREIASADGSTGWISSVLGVHPWQVALFPDEAQQAVWGQDTATRLSSSYAPTGKAVLTEGGYTLSGQWSFSSDRKST